MDNKTTYRMAQISLCISVFIISFWFFSHFNVEMVPTTHEIIETDMWDCPGVGLQEDPTFYFRCIPTEPKRVIQGTGTGILLSWD